MALQLSKDRGLGEEPPPQLLVFAHVPPPVHGQSLMVQLMLDGLPGFLSEVRVHHIDARLSRDMDDVGKGRLSKVFLALNYGFSAIKASLSNGIDSLYYIPAPAKRAAIFRDCLLLSLMRPFFKKIILHWHAVGLGDWIEKAEYSNSLVDRLLAFWHQRLLRTHHMSIVLTEWNRSGPKVYQPKTTTLVYNGLEDPCPKFDKSILRLRDDRQKAIRETTFNGSIIVGFIGHCTAQKGIFDLLDAIALYNSERSQDAPLMTLIVAGEFMNSKERSQFADRIQSQEFLDSGSCVVEHIGFVSGNKKEAFWARCDLLAFPTTYIAESFGLVAIEAMAHGITPVTSDWRMLPEIMGQCGLPVTAAGDAHSLAEGLRDAIGRDSPKELRQAYLKHFSREAHLTSLTAALRLAIS